MSLIRRRALEDAGGWAEWCLTEDSELAIRIHAAGYDSVYLTHPYGRGLIPETFAAYRKQRFRWSYGPVQELQRHWRLFLPRWLGGVPTALTAAQRLHHANHGIDVLCIGLRLLALVSAMAAGGSMLLHGEGIAVPVELWAAATVLLLSSLAIRCLVYTRIVGMRLRHAVGGTLAFAALALVIVAASLRAALLRPAAWHRTSKFQAGRTGLAAVAQARTETVLAAGSSTAGIAMILLSSGGIVTMLGFGLLIQAATYGCAPLLALTADRDLRRAEPLSAADWTEDAAAA
jgi:cellulose synthase/poly-beta-1,6-N-acetylglucosamine synthase-like glycosyltransferase